MENNLEKGRQISKQRSQGSQKTTEKVFLFIKNNPRTPNKVFVSVSAKAGKAVARNRTRRIIKSLIQANKDELRLVGTTTVIVKAIPTRVEEKVFLEECLKLLKRTQK